MTRPSLTDRDARLLAVLTVLAVAACSKSDGGTAPPQPVSVTLSSSTAFTATVGTALTTAPTFTVKDAGGNALGNVAVSIAVSGGGGSLTGAPTRTVAGATPVGVWTLGTTAGANTLTVTISGLTPLTITATGTAGAAVKLVASGGNAQTALAGASLANPLEATVQDQYGNGVPNAQVTFQAIAGGGAITPAQLTTNASGVASGAGWRLGIKGGPQAATATSGSFNAQYTANILSTYPVDLRFFGPPMSTDAQTAFTNAANRIRAAIVAPVANVNLQATDISQCGISGLTGTLTESTQGIIIYASVAPIDGAGKIIAQAGPCFVRNPGRQPIIGVMQFDEADIQTYISSGRFESVVLHEMSHVVGFGTIWFDRNLLVNAAYTNTASPQPTGSTDPRFIGSTAIANCQAEGGLTTHCQLGTGVAVEACGGNGTADGHWRKRFGTCPSSGPATGTSAFGNELMTGWVEGTPNMPWSIITIGQFQDLGYTVNTLAADTYVIPSLMALARQSLMADAAGELHRETVLRPRFTITSGGRVEPIIRVKQ